MRNEIPGALLLLLCSASCGDAVAPERTAGDLQPATVTHEHTRAACAGLGVLDFDIMQRTCAMFVAVRSGALDETVSFGRDFDETLVHWNMCPGGTMVACKPAPDANGDTVIVGIPWPYRTE